MCVVHLHCSAQLSMFNMEKHHSNTIINIRFSEGVFYAFPLSSYSLLCHGILDSLCRRSLLLILSDDGILSCSTGSCGTLVYPAENTSCWITVYTCMCLRCEKTTNIAFCPGGDVCAQFMLFLFVFSFVFLLLLQLCHHGAATDIYFSPGMCFVYVCVCVCSVFVCIMCLCGSLCLCVCLHV